MKKSNKLELTTLKLSSFITNLKPEKEQVLKGGATLHTLCLNSNLCKPLDPGPDTYQ